MNEPAINSDLEKTLTHPWRRTLAKERLLAILLLSLIFAFPAWGQTTLGEVGAKDTPAVGSQWSFGMETGLGYDSNVFRSPSQPYVDYGATGNPMVTPVVQSGLFTPLKLNIEGGVPAGGNHALLASYRFSGSKYWDKDLSRADQKSHKVRLGDEWELGRLKKRRNTLYAGVVILSREKLYVDRDSGLEKTVTSGESISERYSYTGRGAELLFDQRTTPVRFALWGALESRDYKDPGVVSQYDHDYRKVGGDIEFPLADPLSLKVDYEMREHDYLERPSRDLQGRALKSNPPLHYRYNEATATAHYSPDRSLHIYLQAGRLTRHDQYQGYNNYARDKVRFRVRVRPIQPLRLKFAVSSWERTYPNAFAFDEPGQGEKHYEGRGMQMRAEYSHRPFLSSFGEFKTQDTQSTDLRYAYDRYTVTGGIAVEW